MSNDGKKLGTVISINEDEVKKHPGGWYESKWRRRSMSYWMRKRTGCVMLGGMRGRVRGRIRELVIIFKAS